MMASAIHSTKVLRRAARACHPSTRAALSGPVARSSTAVLATRRALPPFSLSSQCAPFHTSLAQRSKRAHNHEVIPEGPPTTDFSKMDILGQAPAPSTSVDICSSDGFKLDSGVSIYHGQGMILAGGEAFEWAPWGEDMRLVNAKGQWEVKKEAFGLLDLLWPRPDLLILGLGPEMRPLSPATRSYLGSLGLRIEVLDTRNAASQFNMLATERGVDDVAAALIPIGWKEGVGANRFD